MEEAECLSCKKCSFISENILELNKNRTLIHEKVDNNTSEDFENEVIEEFEKDESNILALKKKCGLDLPLLVDVKSCDECGFQAHSEGKLGQHKRLTHRILIILLKLVVLRM